MMITSNCPIASSRLGRAALDSGTNRAVSTSAAIPAGMFTQNTPRQPTVSTSAPPSTGPIAMLSPNTPPHTPIARARSAGSVKVAMASPSGQARWGC